MHATMPSSTRPVGLIFSIDRDLEKGSWLDYGMFLQSIMVAARQFGLETCPQAAWLSLLRRPAAAPRHSAPSRPSCAAWRSAIPDPDEKVNTFTPDRMPLAEFVTFVPRLDP